MQGDFPCRIFNITIFFQSHILNLLRQHIYSYSWHWDMYCIRGTGIVTRIRGTGIVTRIRGTGIVTQFYLWR